MNFRLAQKPKCIFLKSMPMLDSNCAPKGPLPRGEGLRVMLRSCGVPLAETPLGDGSSCAGIGEPRLRGQAGSRLELWLCHLRICLSEAQAPHLNWSWVPHPRAAVKIKGETAGPAEILSKWKECHCPNCWVVLAPLAVASVASLCFQVGDCSS